MNGTHFYVLNENPNSLLVSISLILIKDMLIRVPAGKKSLEERRTLIPSKYWSQGSELILGGSLLMFR